MDFEFRLSKKDKKTKARAGIIKTPHGDIQTPFFSPVATRASVRSITPEELKETASQVVLGNTYHLFLRPGIETLKKFGGFAPFMGWDGPTITDSGGYQISFLWEKGTSEESSGKVIKINDEGAVFKSYIDGSDHLLTPEKSVEIQRVLAADIIMALDQPLAKEIAPKKAKEAFVRTLKWEERTFKAWDKEKRKSIQGKYQALYGITQGGTDKDLRKASLKFVLEMGFDGIAMGGETIGTDPKITAESLDTLVNLLPDNKPVHALGLGGGPEGILEAVARGVDSFDNTSITRMARVGLLFVYPEDGGKKDNKFRIDIKQKKFKEVKGPISKKCKCFTCQSFSTAYVHHLIVSGELLGMRLATIHNVHFINQLMIDIRGAILNGDFSSLRDFYLD